MNIPKNIITQFKIWQYIIDHAPEFDEYIESLCDKIACYCIDHNISVDEYEAAIYG